MFCYNSVRLFGCVQVFSRNLITFWSIIGGGISDSGYFLYEFLCLKYRQQSIKVTICSIFIDSVSNQVYFPSQ